MLTGGLMADEQATDEEGPRVVERCERTREPTRQLPPDLDVLQQARQPGDETGDQDQRNDAQVRRRRPQRRAVSGRCRCGRRQAIPLGDVAIFDTDRSITGQDGGAYASREEASADEDFPAQLAVRLFDLDASINHVFVASNQVVVRRSTGWDDDAVAAATDVVSSFFRYYPDA